MAAREKIFELDGLWFRAQKLRGRRAWRGRKALQITLGVPGYHLISNPAFWEQPQESQLLAMISVESKAGATYDEDELAMIELLSCFDGQGVSYRDTPPNADEPGRGWIPIRDMGTLDGFDRVDHATWKMLRWEMLKLTYRPTSAAAGTSADTPPAATTSKPARAQHGPVKPRGSGTPSPTGMSGS